MVAMLAFLTGEASQVEQAAAQSRHALVVGVNHSPQFRFADGTKPRPLHGAERDADAVGEFLVNEFGFERTNVVILKGEQATRQRIEREFQRTAKSIRKGDAFVFHFSGHGTQVDDVKPLDEQDGLDEAICPYDATHVGRNIIRDDELGLWLEEIPARHVTAILDCCHSGTGLKELGDPTLLSRFLPSTTRVSKRRRETDSWKELKSVTKSLGRQLTGFYACRPNESAYERRFLDTKPPVRAGQFTYYFLQGLKNHRADANQDGELTIQEAFDFTTSRLKTFNKAHSRDGFQQLPLLQSDRGDAPLFGILRETDEP